MADRRSADERRASKLTRRVRVCSARQPDVSQAAAATRARLAVRVRRRDVHARSRRRWKTNATGMERLARWRAVCMPVGQHARLRALPRRLPGFPHQRTSGTTRSRRASRTDKIYVVQTNTQGRRAVHADDAPIPGDLVLDPTCGSGTTAYVAEQWGRRWITIDTSRVALALARQRLMGARFPYYLLADSAEGRAKEAELVGRRRCRRRSRPNDIRHGFVYERVQHITLKSIANNPDIKEGMSREEIDAAIRRHADFELLYDKPYEDKQEGPRRRAVHGREPLAAPLACVRRQRSRASAHEQADRGRRRHGDADVRADDPRQPARRPASRTAAATSGSSSTSLEPYAGDVHPGGRRARGRRRRRRPKRVGSRSARSTARSARRSSRTRRARRSSAGDLDLLCVLGFAFDPQVLGRRRRVRRPPTRASPTSPPSGRSAGSRCCSCG